MSGEPERIAGDIETHDGYFKTAFDVRSNGTIVYRMYSGDLRLVRRDAKGVAPIGPKAPIFEVKMSPDGKRAAVVVVDDSTGMGDLWIYDVDTGEASSA